MGNLLSFERSTCKEKRQQLNEFHEAVAAARPALFRFCRKLTSSPWEAEDLVQETLLMAYGRLADKHAGIRNLQSYLFKMASNQWISWCRRNKFVADHGEALPEPRYEMDIFAARDSLGMLLRQLPPRERVALVLSEVFESRNDEIAEILGTTEGAVKSALVRARSKVGARGPEVSRRESRSSAEHERLLGLAVEAFNRRDLDAFAKLFAGNAESHAPGCFFETGVEEIRKGSLFYTIHTHEGEVQPASMRAQAIRLDGEVLFALFDGDRLDDLWKFEVEDGALVRFDCYFCCPDVLAEVAALLGKQANHHGYWFEQGRGGV